MKNVIKINPLTKAYKTQKEIDKIVKSINNNMTNKYLKKMLLNNKNLK